MRAAFRGSPRAGPSSVGFEGEWQGHVETHSEKPWRPPQDLFYPKSHAQKGKPSAATGLEDVSRCVQSKLAAPGKGVVSAQQTNGNPPALSG